MAINVAPNLQKPKKKGKSTIDKAQKKKGKFPM
jgi:hypothetical protein